MPKRKPIDYTPQFGSGIFRPKDEVESERAAIDTATSIPLPAEKEKKEAEKKGRQTARNDKTEFFLHNRQGEIRERDSYGNDPFPPRDKT